MAVIRLVFRVANAVLGDQFIIAHDFQREVRGKLNLSIFYDVLN